MTTFHIPDMSCGHCKATVERTIHGIDPLDAGFGARADDAFGDHCDLFGLLAPCPEYQAVEGRDRAQDWQKGLRFFPNDRARTFL